MIKIDQNWNAIKNLNLRMEFPDFKINVGKATLIYLMFQKTFGSH